MSHDIYEKLRKLIDTHALGCPPAPEIIEILKILFTEGEARVALGLGFRPFAVNEIAARAGAEAGEAGQHLEALANKGLVFAREKNGARIMVDEMPVLTIEKCIGCGLCSTGCPNDAIRMERSVEVPEPPATYMDMGMRLLQEKGKLDDFIRVNTL